MVWQYLLLPSRNLLNPTHKQYRLGAYTLLSTCFHMLLSVMHHTHICELASMLLLCVL